MWVWKNQNEETKNDITFVQCTHPGIVYDVRVIRKWRSRDHRMVRPRLILNQQRDRRKLVRKMPINEFTIRAKVGNIHIFFQNKYSATTEDEVF